MDAMAQDPRRATAAVADPVAAAADVQGGGSGAVRPPR